MMGSVDFFDRSEIALSVNGLLSKLRKGSGRHQWVTVGDVEQTQEPGNKIPKNKRRLWRA